MLKRAEGCMELVVLRKALSHARRIADALFKACEERGWPARLVGEQAVVTVESIPIAVAISEEFDRSEALAKPKTSFSGDYSFHYNQHSTCVYRPSGQLPVTIEATQCHYQPGVRRTWNSTAGKPVEAKLASVLVGMSRLATAVRGENEARAQREREAAERERAAEKARLEQERIQRVLAEQKARLESLLEQSRRWHTAQELRTFIAVARDRRTTGKIDLHGKDQQSWLAWAADQADRLDPLVPNHTPGGAEPEPA